MSYKNKVSMKDYRQAQIVRIDIIAQLYKRGYSYRQIQAEVMARLDLATYSLKTVHKDVKRMLEEWREARIENLDLAIQLELERIDDVIREAWEAWDKSKQDYEKTHIKQTGSPTQQDSEGKKGDGEGNIVTVKIERTSEEITKYGNPRYLEVIHKNLAERRKLLGLYSPEKAIIKTEADMSREDIEAELSRLRTIQNDED